MNDNTQTDSPAMSGDDELAKTLNGGLKFEDTPPASNNDDNKTDDMPASAFGGPIAPTGDEDSDDTPPSIGSLPDPTDDREEPNDADRSTANTDPDLDKIKSSALDDLKPLVGKLNLNAEERFDTLLLIIRSTDDQSLLSEAHAAAKEITDDTKRAEALLDIIKEVDYFNGKK